MKTRSLLLALLFLGSFAILTPMAAATLAWTNGQAKAISSTGAPAASYVRMASVGNNVWSGFENSIAVNIQVAGSTDGGVTWGASHVVSGSVTTPHNLDLEAITSTLLIACFEDGTNFDIYFTKSTNGGSLWSTPALVQSTGTLRQCAIAALSSTAYVITYGDTTNTEYRSVKSTDSGGSWGSPVTVQTGYLQGTATTRKTSNAAAASSTVLVAAWVQSTSANTIHVCRSSDAAATWGGCTTLNGWGSVSLKWNAVGNRFDAATNDIANNIIYYCNSGDLGVTWGCNSIASGLSGLLDVGVGFSTSKAANVAIVWNTASGTTTPFHVSYSTTANTTADFSTNEPLETFGGNREGRGVDVVLTSNGDILATYSVCEAATTCTTGATNNLRFAYASLESAAITGSASVSVTGLVGYDVNPLGGLVVARTNSGATVRAFDAITLTEAASNSATSCSRIDGVMSNYQGTLAAYVSCDGSAVPQDLVFKTAAMQTPTFPQCGSGADHVSLDSFTDGGGVGLGEIGQLKDYPVDQTNNHPFLGSDRCQVVWGFASIGTGSDTGKIGVDLWSNNDNAPDDFITRYAQYGTMNADDFCVGLDPTQDYYLVAAQQGTTTKAYSVNVFTANSNGLGSGQGNHVDATISSTPTVLSSAYAGALGVACGQQNFAVATPTVVGLFSSQGQERWHVATTANNTRIVAVSEVFNNHTGDACTWGTSNCVQFVADKEGNTVRIRDSTGTVTGTINVATLGGVWKGIMMDRTAQNVWCFTSSGIYRFQVIAATTINPVSPQGGVQSPPNPSPTGIFGGGNSGANAAFASLGVSAFGGGLLWAFGVIGACAVGAGTMPSMDRKKLVWKTQLAIGGAILGFFISWAFGFLNTAVVFGIIVLSALAVGFRFYKSRVG